MKAYYAHYSIISIYVYHYPHHSAIKVTIHACIQYMRHCSRKKTTATITQCKLQYYIHHMHVHTAITTITTAQLRDNACIQYMRHCFRKKTTSTAITQCKLQYYVQPPLPPPPPPHSASYNACIHYMHHCSRKENQTTSASYNITSNHHYHHHRCHHSTSHNACIHYMHHCSRKENQITNASYCGLGPVPTPFRPPHVPRSTCAQWLKIRTTSASDRGSKSTPPPLIGVHDAASTCKLALSMPLNWGMGRIAL